MLKKSILILTILVALFSVSTLSLFTMANMDHSSGSNCPFMLPGNCVPTNNVASFINHHAETIQELSQATFSSTTSLILFIALAIFATKKFGLQRIRFLTKHIEQSKQIFFTAKKQLLRWLIFHNTQSPNSMITAHDTA